LIAVLDGLGYPKKTRGKSLAPDLSRSGIGIGDDWRLARLLHQHFAYTNSHLDRFPVLDLCQIPDHTRSSVEFVVCSDVLEHVRPPLSEALNGLYSLVKPGGFAVVTVPLHSTQDEAELYKDLVSYEFANKTLLWKDSMGHDHADSNPTLHEGEGLVLVFRTFSHRSIVSCLLQAGFASVSSPETLPPISGVQPKREEYNVYVARKGIHE
jgi:SAM-dependent methyltransferase